MLLKQRCAEQCLLLSYGSILSSIAKFKLRDGIIWLIAKQSLELYNEIAMATTPSLLIELEKFKLQSHKSGDGYQVHKI